jgi:hypothetical protein
MRSIGSFYPPFCMGRIGVDMMNAQCCERTTKLRQTLRILGVKIHCTTIGVDFRRNAVMLDVCLPELKDTYRIFFLGKTQHHTSRGIVNGNQQTTPRTTSLEPIVITAIELNE